MRSKKLIERFHHPFFNLQPGLSLALWPRRSLAADSTLALRAASSTVFALASLG